MPRPARTPIGARRSRSPTCSTPATGVDLVQVKQVGEDKSAFPLRYDPTNPAANAAGYVKVPNVNTFIEMTDMRDAEQSYSANLQVLSVSRSMLTRVIGMLK